MIYLFLVLIVIAAVGLAFMVLIQNPKGGGLAGNVGGISNQLMGVKQTTDVLELSLIHIFPVLVGKGESVQTTSCHSTQLSLEIFRPCRSPAPVFSQRRRDPVRGNFRPAQHDCRCV